MKTKKLDRDRILKYLSVEDQRLYMEVKDSEDPKDQTIKRLLLSIGNALRATLSSDLF